MKIKNTKTQYGLITILFHWLIAALIIGLIPLGLYMTGLPINHEKLKLYGWHKELGILVLMLALLRISWRISNISPLLPAYLPAWQKWAARTVHFSFYLFMLGMPLTGWMISSAAQLPLSFFGLFVLPDIVPASEHLRMIFAEVHQWLGYTLIVVIGMHIGAVIQHYLIYKDNLLRRMLP